MSNSKHLNVVWCAAVIVGSSTSSSAQAPPTTSGILPPLYSSSPKSAKASVVAKLIWKNRRTTERILGKPLWLTGSRMIHGAYSVKGGMAILIEWLPNNTTREMDSLIVLFKSQPTSWKQAIRRIGFSASGAQLVDGRIIGIHRLSVNTDVQFRGDSLIFSHRHHFVHGQWLPREPR